MRMKSLATRPYRRGLAGPHQLLWQFVSYAILITLALTSLAPLVWMLVTSVKDRREVFTTVLPSAISFSNYERIWERYDLAQHFFNSMVVTSLTVSIVVVASTLAAYVFAKFDFPGRNAIFYMLISTIMIPKHALLIPMFIFLKDINLINTLPGLSISFLGASIGFSIFVMRAFFQSLPDELGDAGRIDGCSEFDVFLRIYLPLTRPGLATIVIFQFVDTWNEFLFSTTFILDPTQKTIQPAIYQVVGRYSVDYPALTSGLVLAVLPMVLMYLVMQRQFINGLTEGALRG